MGKWKWKAKGKARGNGGQCVWSDFQSVSVGEFALFE